MIHSTLCFWLISFRILQGKRFPIPMLFQCSRRTNACLHLDTVLDKKNIMRTYMLSIRIKSELFIYVINLAIFNSYSTINLFSRCRLEIIAERSHFRFDGFRTCQFSMNRFFSFSYSCS